MMKPLRMPMHRLCWAVLGLLFGSVAAAAQPPGYACATAHPLATQACMDILARGGNAFDAAVAASAAIAVVEPTGSGLGGGGFWLLHRQADALDVFIDGRETAPAAASRDMYLEADGKANSRHSRFGALAAGIPGEPAALEHIAEHYGSLALATVLAPAIRYAEDGFAVDAKLAAAIERFEGSMSPAARAVFLRDGRPLSAGDKLRQPDLAWTLRRLATAGAEDFYQGQIAQRLLVAVHEAGGSWSAEDLARYAIVERAPIVSWYLGNRIVSSPPPSAGGLGLAQVLQQLEVLGWHDDGTIASRHLLVETLRRAYRDRAAWLGDPDFVRIPLQHLASRSYARELAGSIDLARATPSADLPPAAPSSEGHNTTHLSVLDADGNRVAATLSINLPFGSGLMAAGTGVLLNDEMDDFSSAPGVANAYGLVGSEPNSIAPHKRPLSSMTPTFVEGPRGLLIVGTPGGSRIVTMVIQAVLAWIGGAELQDVVAAPRLHQQYLPDVVELEPDYADAGALAALSAMGYTLQLSERQWGNMQAVAWYPSRGEIDAASDPRAVGQAAVSTVRKTD